MEPKRALAPLSHIDNQIQENNDPITFLHKRSEPAHLPALILGPGLQPFF